MSLRASPWWRQDRGSVTAEFAVTLPAVLAVIVLAVGALSVQSQRVVLQDAVADAARLVARDEIGGVSAVNGAVPGASASVENRGDVVCVHAQAPMRLWGAITLTQRASACALAGGW